MFLSKWGYKKRQSNCVICHGRRRTKKYKDGTIIYLQGFHETILGIVCFVCYPAIDWILEIKKGETNDNIQNNS